MKSSDSSPWRAAEGLWSGRALRSMKGLAHPLLRRPPLRRRTRRKSVTPRLGPPSPVRRDPQRVVILGAHHPGLARWQKPHLSRDDHHECALSGGGPVRLHVNHGRHGTRPTATSTRLRRGPSCRTGKVPAPPPSVPRCAALVLRRRTRRRGSPTSSSRRWSQERPKASTRSLS